MQLLRTLARGGATPVTRRTITVAAPAAATDITITPENGRAWEVMSISTSLVTDATVASRALSLGLLDGPRTLWAVPALAAQVASTTFAYSWIAGYPSPMVAAVDVIQAMPLPPIVLLPGWSVLVNIGNVEAGDQLGATQVQVLESFVGDAEAEYDLARVIVHHAEAFALAVAGEVTGA